MLRARRCSVLRPKVLRHVHGETEHQEKTHGNLVEEVALRGTGRGVPRLLTPLSGVSLLNMVGSIVSLATTYWFTCSEGSVGIYRTCTSSGCDSNWSPLVAATCGVIPATGPPGWLTALQVAFMAGVVLVSYGSLPWVFFVVFAENEDFVAIFKTTLPGMMILGGMLAGGAAGAAHYNVYSIKVTLGWSFYVFVGTSISAFLLGIIIYGQVKSLTTEDQGSQPGGGSPNTAVISAKINDAKKGPSKTPAHPQHRMIDPRSGKEVDDSRFTFTISRTTDDSRQTPLSIQRTVSVTSPTVTRTAAMTSGLHQPPPGLRLRFSSTDPDGATRT